MGNLVEKCHHGYQPWSCPYICNCNLACKYHRWQALDGTMGHGGIPDACSNVYQWKETAHG